MAKSKNFNLGLDLDDTPVINLNKKENVNSNASVVETVTPNNFVPPQVGFKKQMTKEKAQYLLPTELIKEVKDFCKSRGYAITEVVEYCLKMGLEVLKKGE
ncbi:MAG: hypothetical protein K2I49_00850 [Ureaplasma sp.]|nr:hypothetical protein [Ureaplasma sp.]